MSVESCCAHLITLSSVAAVGPMPGGQWAFCASPVLVLLHPEQRSLRESTMVIIRSMELKVNSSVLAEQIQRI
eukprot:539541-Amphidinium_carterae.1